MVLIFLNFVLFCNNLELSEKLQVWWKQQHISWITYLLPFPLDFSVFLKTKNILPYKHNTTIKIKTLIHCFNWNFSPYSALRLSRVMAFIAKESHFAFSYYVSIVSFCFLEVQWSWNFWRLQTHYLVKCLSVWGSPIFPRDNIQVIHIWKEYHRRDSVFSEHLIK